MPPDPSPRWSRAAVFAVSALALCGGFAMSALALGIGGKLSGLLEALHWIGAALAVSSAGLALRPRATAGVAAICGSAALCIGLGAYQTFAFAPSPAAIEATQQRNRDDNALLLARAETTLACANGDIVVLTRDRKTQSDRERLLLGVAPKDRTVRGDLLLVASGEYRVPPRLEDLAAYRKRHGGMDCAGARYPTLDAVYAAMLAHYTAERAILAKDYP